jgi:hypothetical protein
LFHAFSNRVPDHSHYETSFAKPRCLKHFIKPGVQIILLEVLLITRFSLYEYLWQGQNQNYDDNG